MTAEIVSILSADLAVASAIAIVAGLIHGFAGFGVGLVMVPSLAILLGPVEAVAVSSITGIAGTAQLIPGALRVMDRPLIWPILAPTFITVPAGAYLLLLIDPLIMQRAIGALVFGLALLLVRGYRWSGSRSAGVGLSVGALGGLVGGSTSTAGPLFTAYILSSGASARTIRGGILVVTTTVGVITVVALAVGDAVGVATLVRSIVLIDVDPKFRTRCFFTYAA